MHAADKEIFSRGAPNGLLAPLQENPFAGYAVGKVKTWHWLSAQSALKYSLDLVCTPAEFPQHTPDWQALLADPGVDAGFFCDPVVVWGLTCFEENEKVALVRCRQDGDTVALIPFRIPPQPVTPRVGPWRMPAPPGRILWLCDAQFAIRRGWTRYTVLEGAWYQLCRGLTADLLIAENFPVNPVSPRQTHHIFGRVHMHDVQRTFLLDLPDNWETYLASLSANTRSTLRRKFARLKKKTADTLICRRFREVGEMEELARYLADLWPKTWQGQSGKGPAPSLPVLKHFAQHGWVRSYVLLVKEQPIACVVGYQYRGTYYYESPGYDPAWREHSPGIVLNYLLLEDLFVVDPPRVVDFGFGYNQYKETLGNRPEDRGFLWMPLSSKGRILAAGGYVLERLYSMIRPIVRAPRR